MAHDLVGAFVVYFGLTLPLWISFALFYRSRA